MRKIISIICTLTIIGVLLIGITSLPQFGDENILKNRPLANKYIRDGLKDTGSTNIVTGIILDYRAFDTFAEATVLFTGIICVMLLLKKGDEELDE